MKILLFICAVLIASVGRADDRINSDEIFVAITHKGECTLSRLVEKIADNKTVQLNFKNRRQQMFLYHGEDCEDYRKSLGTTHYPTIYKFQRINNVWYKADTLDPMKTPITLTSILSFINMRVKNPQPKPKPEPPCPDDWGSGST